MTLRDQSPILICIDLQMGFLQTQYWGRSRNNPDAEQVCALLQAHWRSLGLDIIHIRHRSRDPNSPLSSDHAGFAFNPLNQPQGDEIVITKSVNSAFIGTQLQDLIDAKSAPPLVIVGLTTDHCVSTSTRMAGNFGYDTYLVSDATATFDKTGPDGRHYDAELIHQTALASLNGEFATVIPHKQLLEL